MRFIDGIPGQVNLFAYMESNPPIKRKRKRVIKSKPLAEADGNYIDKGARIETLAREKFLAAMEGCSFSEIEEKIYSVKFNTNLYILELVKGIAKVIRPYIAKIEVFDDGDEMYETLTKLVDFDISLRKVDVSSESHVGAVQRLRYRLAHSTDIVCLSLKEDGYPTLNLYGYRASAVSSSKASTGILMRDGTNVADIATTFGWLILFTQYNRGLKDPALRGALESAFADNRSEANLWCAVHNCTGNGFKIYGKDRNALKPSEIIEGLKGTEGKIATPFYQWQRPSDKVLDCFKDICGFTDMDIQPSQRKAESVLVKNKDRYTLSDKTDIWQWIVPKEVEWDFVATDPIKYFDRGFGTIRYNDTLYRCKKESVKDPAGVPSCWPLPDSRCLAGYDIFKTVLERVWDEKGQLINKAKYYRDMQSGKHVATAYQTKKNIPDKVLKEMEQSSFNKSFGYVEIDEGCDLDSVRAIAEEFGLFKETYLFGFKSDKVSLRFRKLGKHKASGLYYPMFGCLCVDIHSPSSFIHEYGHCLDYLQGGRMALSDQAAFYSTYSLYKRELMNALYHGTDEYQKLCKKGGKYNLDYYLLHTEAFARCFEMYVVSCLKVDTSLCKQEDKMGWAYPQNEELLQSIKIYFDNLLVTVNRIEEGNALTA